MGLGVNPETVMSAQNSVDGRDGSVCRHKSPDSDDEYGIRPKSRTLDQPLVKI